MDLRLMLTIDEQRLFSGKTVLITGASRGLGRHIAEAFWNHGADIFIVARSEPVLTGVCVRLAELGQPGQRSGHLAIDLTSPDAPACIFQALKAFSGRIDVLINNAALLGPIGPLDENDWAAWQSAIQVNLVAPAALCRLAIPQMRAAGTGAIVNISGGGATSPDLSFHRMRPQGLAWCA